MGGPLAPVVGQRGDGGAGFLTGHAAADTGFKGVWEGSTPPPNPKLV